MLTVLRLPGALRAFLPALLGRSALAMAGLDLIFGVQGSTGSFTSAGIASATFGLANVVTAPWRSRAVDRWGQRRSLTTLSSIQAAGFVGLAAASTFAAPLMIFIVLAAIIGVTVPPLGAAMRVIWAQITTPGDERKKAFSLDAVAEELLFVVGPVAIAGIITTTTASTGLLLTGGVVLLGTFGLTTSAASAAHIGSSHQVAVGQRPLRQPGFAAVLVTLAGVGCVLGVAEIAAPAIAEEHAVATASGWVLAAFAAGSAIGGLLYGHVRWAASLGTKMLVLGLSMGGVAVAVSQAHHLALFTVGLVVLGLFLAPSIITGYLVADALVPENSRTESSTWVNTAVNLGAALASAAAGLVIDRTNALLPLALVGVLALLSSAAVPWKHLRHLSG